MALSRGRAGIRAARVLRMARTGLDRSFGRSGARRRMRATTRSASSAVPALPHRRSQVLPVRRGSERRHQAAGMQGVRQGLHARDTARRADGVIRRRLRRLLSIWRLRPAASGKEPQHDGGCMNNVGAQLSCGRRRGGLSARTVTLAHGGGGKAMRDLVDDVFVAAFDNPVLDAAGGPGANSRSRTSPGSATSWRSRPIPTLSTRCSSPAATSASLPSAAQSMISLSAGAIPLYLTCSAIIEEGLEVDTLRAVAKAMAVAAG